MLREITVLGLGIALGVAAPALAADCRLAGDNNPALVDGALAYSTPVLKVDADGAPNSYRPDGKGLSYTCDGVVAVVGGVRITPSAYPDTWQQKCLDAWRAARASNHYSGVDIFGFETGPDGAPLVQMEGDPLPGEAFITTTAVTIPGMPDGVQRRYVDAQAIPFVVLPSRIVAKFKIKPGALAAVWRPKTQTLTFAVYGDMGGALDEASVRLHADLGGKPIVTIKGVPRAKRNITDRVVIIVFADKAIQGTLDADAWRSLITVNGQIALDAWGGAERLKACRP